MFKLLFLIPFVLSKRNPYRFSNRYELDNALNECFYQDKTFKTCTGPNDAHISEWDVSNVRNLKSMFKNPKLHEFSVDISQWDISNSDLRIKRPKMKLEN